jgi:hypothetical protein
MKKMRKPLSWCTVLVFWGLGALFLRRIWDYQQSLPDPLGSSIEFTVIFLVTFYVLALFPIKYWVDRFFSLFGLSIVTKEDI